MPISFITAMASGRTRAGRHHRRLTGGVRAERGKGMEHLVEPRVRRLVAESLGIGLEELTPDVSLTDDLAADSLDLVELSIALEAELGVDVPEQLLQQVRTYGDLVQATLATLRRPPTPAA